MYTFFAIQGKSIKKLEFNQKSKKLYFKRIIILECKILFYIQNFESKYLFVFGMLKNAIIGMLLQRMY